MGTDCLMIIERIDDRLSNDKFEWWDTIGMYNLNRNYSLFDDIREKATPGYPGHINSLTKQVLNDLECWGDCYLPYSEFKKLAKKHKSKDAIYIKKSQESRCRCIFRFDN